jgi:hypothetical protein
LEGYTCYENYTVGWSVIQWPKSVEDSESGTPITIYGRVYIEGVTDQTGAMGDAHPLVKAQWGVSETDSNPTTDPGDFSWEDATLNSGMDETWGNNDEYTYDSTPPAAGTYYYVYRFSADGGSTWTYCDTDENNSVYDDTKKGVATIVDPSS